MSTDARSRPVPDGNRGVRGRCPICKLRVHLTRDSVLGEHPNKIRERCTGAGSAPIPPDEDTTPDWRDRQTYYQAVRDLQYIGSKSFRTAKDKKDLERIRRILQTSLTTRNPRAQID